MADQQEAIRLEDQQVDQYQVVINLEVQQVDQYQVVSSLVDQFLEEHLLAHQVDLVKDQ